MILKIDLTRCPDPAAELSAAGVTGFIIGDLVSLDDDDALLLKLTSNFWQAFRPVE
jgi:hypothetical protein